MARIATYIGAQQTKWYICQLKKEHRWFERGEVVKVRQATESDARNLLQEQLEENPNITDYCVIDALRWPMPKAWCREYLRYRYEQ